MCHFRHSDVGGQPSKKSKKSGAKGSVAQLKETIQLGCVSQDYPRKKSILREVGKLGSNHTVKFSKGTCATQKFGKRNVHRRASFKNANLRSEFRGLQNSRKVRQERCAHRGAWDLASKKEAKRYVLLSCRSLGNASTLFEEA